MSSSIDDSTTDKEATDDASLRSIQKENTNEEDDLASALELKLKVTVKESEVETADKEDRNDDDNEVPEALQRVAEWMQNGSVTNVLVLTGAGVSVAAGIPDFRTPGTGLYDNLQKYNLPYAEAVFDIDYYQRNPLPFVQLASELWPNELDDAFPKPTLTHSFIALLSDKGLLLRNYSQNIDGLEHMANIPEEKLVECHGHFRTASCIQCKKPANIASVKESIVVHQQVPVCVHCSSSKKIHKQQTKRPAYVKPDIVFFGEQLPIRFHSTLPADLKRADLCLILGTSLQVPPTAHIPDLVDPTCKRVLLNRELVGNLRVGSSSNINSRDVFHSGDCDDSILRLARLLGWENELLEKHERTRTKAKLANRDAENKKV